MTSQVPHSEVLPASPARTGIGWVLGVLLPERDLSRAEAKVDAFSPAAERHSARETLVANGLFGLWSFLATGALLGAHLRPELTVIAWLPTWIAGLHALILLPPLLLRPWKSARWAPQAQAWMVLALVLLTAVGLLLQPHLFPRVVGAYGLALMGFEACLRLLRAGLRLARTAN